MTEAVVRLLVGALEGQLRVIETGVGQALGQLLADPDSGGDEVSVEAALRGVTREIDNVAPRRRLAAREMNMQRAERGGLAAHALPGFAVNLGAGTFERQRIGAIETTERAAMGELDQKPDRRRGRR